jgi:hypothetical protein
VVHLEIKEQEQTGLDFQTDTTADGCALHGSRAPLYSFSTFTFPDHAIIFLKPEGVSHDHAATPQDS